MIWIIALLLMFAPMAYAETSTNSDTLFHTWYSSPVWTDGSFSGTMFRDFDGSPLDGASLEIQVDHSAGGFDTAIRGYHTHHDVDSMHPDYYIRACYNVTETSVNGDWWVGPKINVNFDGYPEWYENYVVENSSRTPSTWADVFAFYSGTYIGDTYHDGSVYKHYYVPWNDWNQMWAVRQTYRDGSCNDGGVVSMAVILKKWREVMPNHNMDEIRFNFESIGDNDMDVTISNAYAPEDYIGPVEPKFPRCN